jgi:hypothetical protein
MGHTSHVERRKDDGQGIKRRHGLTGVSYRIEQRVADPRRSRSYACVCYYLPPHLSIQIVGVFGTIISTGHGFKNQLESRTHDAVFTYCTRPK